MSSSFSNVSVSAVGVWCAVFFCLFPFMPSMGLINGAVTERALVFMGLVQILLIIAVFSSSKKLLPLSITPLFSAILLWLGVQFVAAIMGVYPEHSFWSDSLRATGVFFLLHVVLFVILTALLFKEHDWLLIQRVVIASAGLFSLLTILGVGGVGLQGSFFGTDLSVRGLSFVNETYAGLYLVLAGALACLELARNVSNKWNLVAAGAIALMAFSPIFFNTNVLLGRIPLSEIIGSPQILLGYTRASGVVFFSMLAFLFVWWGISHIPKERIRKVIKPVFTTLIVGVCVYSATLLMMPGSFVQTALSQANTLSRFITWEVTKSAVAERPILGWGPENYAQAFESHFVPALYTTGGRVEIWFDKAHNVALDTLIASGALGVLASVIVIVAYVWTVWCAKRNSRVSESVAAVLLLIPPVHLLQLWTAFDVVPTYVLLGSIGGYVLWLEQSQRKGTVQKTKTRKMLIAFFLTFFFASFTAVFFYELPKQTSLAQSLTEKNFTERQKLTTVGLSRTSDFYALRRASNVFSGGVLDILGKESASSEVITYARPILTQYLDAYERYLAVQPKDYRAHINYAYLLLLASHWGDERSQEAISVIEKAYSLSPENRLTYVLHIMAHVYNEDIPAARAVFVKLESISPDIEFTKLVGDWLTEQERRAPIRTFLKLPVI